MEEIRKIDVVIVTYNPNDFFNRTLENISEKVRNIFIIDNNSENKDEILRICSLKKNIKLICNETNIGLAAAQNKGIKCSLESSSEFILFLDDDSEISDDYVSKLLEIYDQKQEKEKIAILSGEIIQNVGREQIKTKVRYEKNGNILRQTLRDKETRDDVIFGISSGSLIKTEIFEKVGFFKEDYFIDEIDTEFSLRVLKYGYKLLVTSEVKLYQNYGNRSKINCLMFNVYPTNHSPKRLYYKYRNFNKYKKEYKDIFPKHIKFITKQKVLNALRVLIFEKQKILKLKYIMEGLKDGK